MRLSADFVTLYNPVTGSTEHTATAPSGLGCAINSTGPGARDAGAYAAGDVVWFYFIWGSAPGLSTINSKIGPIDLNSGGTTGPILPTGFTSYAPAFPIPMIDAATCKPMMLGQSYSNIQVRGNVVNYPTPPLIEGAGYPTMAFDLSKWIPPQALLSHFLVDAELHAPACVQVIGGLVCSTPSGNFLNQSLYPQNGWAASDVDAWTALPANRQMTATFAHSGTNLPDNAVCVIFVNGYTFSNG
jgi:hypothetical protein